jgi:hypothetical protein
MAELHGRIAWQNCMAELLGRTAGQTHKRFQQKNFANVNATKGIDGTDYIKYFLTIDKLHLRGLSLQL